MNELLNFRRLGAMIFKEFIQMRRDRLTFLMMVGLPVMQLMLFGFAINQDPRHLPAGFVNGDQGPLSRALAAQMQSSTYFELVAPALSPEEAEAGLRMGRYQFVVFVPEGFERAVRRGDAPALLVEADATDPAAAAAGISALNILVNRALEETLRGAERPRPVTSAPLVDVRVHTRFNPESKTSYNIVPGLMGVVLTMTMVMITALAITRERERGTMENLLAMPVEPFEVLVGKIVPYILVGYVQIGIILVVARVVFHVPFEGSLPLLLACALPFVMANLGVGVTFSTLAKNQLQAMQLAFFFFLPSILLSGFMFPFRGMPVWAQTIGEVLPLTHFLRIVRGILLKGNGWPEVAGEVGALAAFLTASLTVGVLRYRQTLD